MKNPPLNWRNISWLLASLFVMVIGVPLALWAWGVSTMGVIVFLIALLPAPLAITAGYHRLFSHRSYEASPFVRLSYLLIGAAAFEGSALEWSHDHRRHHLEVDTDSDPYNIRRGFFYAHMGWLFHQSVPVSLDEFPVDLRRDAFVLWQHQNYLFTAIFFGLAIPALMGYLMGNFWGGLLYGGIVRAVINQHSTFLINSLSHMMGSRPFSLKNSARDNLLMAFLAFGEGYHNFHHRFQTDYRNGFRWYHWDPTKWLIQSFSWFGLTRNLKRVPLSVIMVTRLQTAQQLLTEKGFATDRLSAFREKVLAAQRHWRTVYQEYLEFKRNVSSRSTIRKKQLQMELKIARIEFKSACRQWYAYARAIRGIGIQSA